MDNAPTLSAVLVRFEERFAVLRSEMTGELRWPISHLPDQLKIGDAVTLKISTSKTESEEQYARMRRLLEELIN